MSSPLVPGVVYIVKTGGTDGTLHAGDRVSLLPDGGLMNHAAAGWLDASEVAAVLPGATFEPCQAWVEAERKRREQQDEMWRRLGWSDKYE